MFLRYRVSLIAIFAPLAVIVFGVMVLLYEPQILISLRYAIFDQYQRWHPREQVDFPIRIVDIDEESIARLGQWPWPRTRLAELTDRLNEAQAAVIGFDILFAEPDRTSPKNMMQSWGSTSSLAQCFSQFPDHDTIFAHSLEKSPSVLGFTAGFHLPDAVYPNWPFRFITLGALEPERLYNVGQAVMPLPAFAAMAKGLGSMSFVPDADGVIRRVPLILRLEENLVPSLAVEVLRVSQMQSNITLHSAIDGGVAAIRIGTLKVPTTAQGEMWMHYAAERPERYLPAWKVLAGEVDPEWLRSHFVLLGSSAAGLMDLRFSPLGRPISGVEVHAQALEQILSGTILRRPAISLEVEMLAMICAGLLLSFIALSCRIMLSVVTTVTVLALMGVWAWHAFVYHSLLFDPFVPGLVILASVVSASVLHHLGMERRQQWVRSAFSHYVSPNLVDHLLSHPEALELGGKRQVCSFVFSDLAGFTAFLEQNDPVKVAGLLNAYLDGMIRIAFLHQGTLDRIVGDAVAIMFSAPVEQPDHARRALMCALEMSAFSKRYSAQLQAQGINFGHTRFGVHTGEVVVGNFGGSTIFDYRALGDAVNTTSRLEEANRYLGTQVCISSDTLMQARYEDIAVRPIGRLLLRGKVTPLMVYEPLAFPAGDAREDKAYMAAFALVEEGNPAAKEAFLQLAQERPDDPLVKLHLTRLILGERDDLIILPDK